MIQAPRNSAPAIMRHTVNNSLSRRMLLCLGRTSDILNALPIARRMADAGERPAFAVAREYAAVLDGVDYVDPVIYNGRYLDAANAARSFSRSYQVVQAQGSGWGLNPLLNRTNLSVTEQGYQAAGLLAEFQAGEFDRLPLPRANLPDVLNLIGRPDLGKSGNPVIVTSLGVLDGSRVFSSSARFLDLIQKKFGSSCEVLNLEGVKFTRPLDPLAIMDIADLIVTADNFHLHLAGTTMMNPYIAMVSDNVKEAAYTRGNCLLKVKYDHFTMWAADLIEMMQKTLFKPIGDFQLIHSYHRSPIFGGDTRRRERLAEATWRCVGATTPVFSVGMGMEDMPRLFQDADRQMPYVKDLIDGAFDKCDSSSDYIMLTNSDTCLTTDIYQKIGNLLRSGLQGFSGSRRDFRRLDEVIHPSQIQTGTDYCGTDIFVFSPHWWEKVRDKFPDMVLGQEAWDLVLREFMHKDGMPLVPDLVYHESHSTRWAHGQNQMLPSRAHNLKLAVDAIASLGIHWKPGTILNRAHAVNPTAPRTAIAGLTIQTFNRWHIGDNLIHLNFLRKVAIANPDLHFIHGAISKYLPELVDIAADVKNIKLIPIEGLDPKIPAIDSWKNADGYWDHHPEKMYWARFHLQWFRVLAQKMGVANPVTRIEDLFMDSPAIQSPNPLSMPFDVLLINSRPGSGQFSAWSEDYFEPVIAALVQAGKSVITTHPSKLGVPCTQTSNLTCAGIGNLSLHCSTIIAVSTGPSWPTWNVWNRDSVTLRIMLLERENLAEMGNNQFQVQTREQVLDILRQKGVVS